MKWSVFILLSLISFVIHSQKHYTRNLTIQDGLPSNKIRDIYKDSRGYIWIGTSAGLTRYDGNQFKTYTQHDGLAGNRVWSITEDDRGNLWLGCYGDGISKFDGRKFLNYNEDSGLVNNNVRKIKYSKKHGGLLVGTICGFSYLKDGTFTNFTDSLYKDLLQVTSFLETESFIYLLTYRQNERFIKFNPNKKTFKYLPKNHRYHYKSTNTTCSFVSSKQDTLIGYFMKGMKVYRNDSVFLDRNVGQVFDIVEDKKGDIWFASWNSGNLEEKDDRGGIYKWSNDTSVYCNEKLGINTELGWCLHYDENENMLWIGTLDKGIYLFPINGISYESAEKYNSEKPQFNDIFFDSNERMWLTVGDKIIVKEKKQSSTFEKESLVEAYKAKYVYRNDPEGSYSKYKNLISKGEYKYENPYLFYDSIIPKGRLYTPASYKSYFKDPKIYNFYKIIEDRKGNVWINSNAGYYYFLGNLNPIPDGWEHIQCNFFFNKDNEKCKLNFNNLRIFYYDTISMQPINRGRKKYKLRENITYSDFPSFVKEGEKYWIVNKTDGLSMYEYDTLHRFHYLQNVIKTNLNCIAVDSVYHKIVGTISGEIYILEEQNDSILLKHTISNKDGIIGTVINWMVVDRQNNLWAGTNKGLNIISLDDLYNENEVIIKTYTKEDGYFDYTSKKAILNPPKDTLYVLSDDYLTKMPVSLPSKYNKKIQPELIINDILVNYKKFDWSILGSINDWSELPESKPKLDHKNDNLIFNYGFKYFKNPENVRYSYKMEGLQDEWSDYSSEQKAVFTSLDHGSYTFRLKGYLLSNPEQVVEKSFSFEILPPWWKTIWFYTIVTILFITVIITFIQYRLNIIRKKAYIQNRMNLLKLEALQAQMNPHFIFNGFNTLQKYILEKEVDPALQYVNQFSGLIRKTLDNSSCKRINIEDEINYLKDYIELEKRKTEKFEFTINIDHTIDKMNTFIPPMLIQPFVENAIQHGIRHLSDRKGQLDIKIERYNENHLKCIVQDNGIGRKKAKEINEQNNRTYKSKATDITKERLKLIGGYKDVYINYFDLLEHNKNIGTKVEILIPINNNFS